MRVAYVITQSDVIGGASVHVLDLATGAASAGVDVTVLVGGRGELFRRLTSRNIHCVSLEHLKREFSPVSDFLAFLELRRHLSELQPDLVHLHSSKAGVIGRLAANALSIPTVFTAHGWAFTEGISPLRRTIYRQIERYMVRFSDRIITVSDYDRRLALSAGVGSETMITTIHNGIPLQEHTAQVDKPDDTVTMIMVARFDDQKDQESVIRAVTDLPDLPDLTWRLHFVGDGPNRTALEDMVGRQSRGKHIFFHGACDDVPERLAQADIFILMSNWEGLPLSILEAMRAGLPVIASNVGGVSETIDDGETGILVSRGDVDQLRIAISTLIGDAELRKSMGDRAIKKFETEFSFEGMLSSTMNIYSQLCPNSCRVDSTLNSTSSKKKW